MARLLAILTLAGSLVAPNLGRADALYSFKDADGVWHFTNVPQDSRYRRVKGGSAGHGMQRVAGRKSSVNRAGAPLQWNGYDSHIRAAAEKYGLAPPLLKAV